MDTTTEVSLFGKEDAEKEKISKQDEFNKVATSNPEPKLKAPLLTVPMRKPNKRKAGVASDNQIHTVELKGWNDESLIYEDSKEEKASQRKEESQRNKDLRNNNKPNGRIKPRRPAKEKNNNLIKGSIDALKMFSKLGSNSKDDSLGSVMNLVGSMLSPSNERKKDGGNNKNGMDPFIDLAFNMMGVDDNKKGIKNLIKPVINNFLS